MLSEWALPIGESLLRAISVRSHWLPSIVDLAKLLSARRDVPERGEDVLAFKVGAAREQLLGVDPGGELTEHGADRQAGVADAGQAAHPVGVDGDSLAGHPSRVACGAVAAWWSRVRARSPPPGVPRAAVAWSPVPMSDHRYSCRVTKPQTETVELDDDLVRRARHEAERRGVAPRQLIESAIEHELADEAQQPPFSLIGAFSSGRGDLSKLASEDVFEPEPFR